MIPRVLIIYTGGTIGMKQDGKTRTLVPFDFRHIEREVPELKRFGYKIDTYEFKPAIDSSDVKPEFWIGLCQLLKEKYDSYDGFVILHGTDTMSYTASALSFMLEDLEKPVILTGSQLPIGKLRTDAKENLISSIEIAVAVGEDGFAMVPEVCVYFESQLFRGNRTIKYNAENFRAFRSVNYPPLAEAGVHIKYNRHLIRYPARRGRALKVCTKLDTNVAILKIFPGITQATIDAVLSTRGCRAVIIETFGSGNAPTGERFISSIKRAQERGVVFVNVTQCQAGRVDMGAYATGMALQKAGVISGYDSTTEAALCKLFVLLGKYSSPLMVKRYMRKNFCGEISV